MRLGPGFPVVQMTVLPIEPGVPQFMSKDISAACYRETLSDVDRFGVVVPYPVGIRVPAVHI